MREYLAMFGVRKKVRAVSCIKSEMLIASGMTTIKFE